MKPRLKKLTLSRETLRQLESADLSRVAGGLPDTQPQNTCPCPTGPPICGD